MLIWQIFCHKLIKLTLFFPGTYALGLNETLAGDVVCAISPLNQPGHCMLLNACTDIFAQFVDSKSYEKYFCEVQGKEPQNR